MKLETLDDLFLDNLRDILDAEHQICKALPKMAKKASCDKLRAGFQEHLVQSEEHVRRLDRIFDHLGHRVRRKNARPLPVSSKKARN